MEMDIVLRTMFRELVFEPTTEHGERMLFRGIAFAPARGGVAVVHRRQPAVRDLPEPASIPLAA
jgi:hypothetical protein